MKQGVFIFFRPPFLVNPTHPLNRRYDSYRAVNRKLRSDFIAVDMLVTLRNPLLALCLLVTYVTSQIDGDATSCPYKECHCTGQVINCTHLHLNKVPALQEETGNYTDLWLNDNNITHIENDTFPRGIITLDLRNNPITRISHGAFRGCAQTLKTLSFSNAAFNTLPNALGSLTSLDRLDIQDVALTTDPELRVQYRLGMSVTDLRLSRAGFTKWPTWLKRFILLKKLDLSQNDIGDLPEDSLEPWATLMTELVLDSTGATSIAAIQSLTSLEKLSMFNNSISDHVLLSYHLIPTRKTLKSINLNYNTMTQLPRLQELTSLTNLDLHSNNISRDNMGALPPSLTVLHLARNAMTAIPVSVKDLTNLKLLSILGNSITRIGPHEFPANSGLSSLLLNENPIQDIAEHAFDNIRNLTYLNLFSLDLERLPHALVVLDQLTTLDLSSNPRLSCTCDEIDVVKWMQLSTDLKIYGKCNHVNIEHFVPLILQKCQ